MKRHFIFSLLLLTFVSIIAYSQGGGLNVYQINNFKGGLNTRIDPILLDDSQTPESRNILFDENNTLFKRYGYSLWATLPSSGNVLGMFEYTRSSGERWLVVQIDSAIYTTNNNGNSWVLIKSGLSTINPVNYTIYLDELWMTNGFDDVFTYNGSAVASYSFIPKGKYIITHFDQIFIANILGQPSSIYFSGVLSGPKVKDGWKSYNAFSIGKDDGDIITGLVSYKNNIVVFKTNSTWGILGYGNDMELIKYSNIYGCVSHRSIQEYKTDLVFLSKQGLCSFNGGVIQQIDKDIDNITKNITIASGSGNLKSWLQNEYTDFDNSQEKYKIDLITDKGAVIPQIYTLQPLLTYSNKDTEGEGVTEAEANYNYSRIFYSTFTTFIPSYHWAWLELPSTGYTLKDVSINLSRASSLTSTATIKMVLYDCTETFGWSGTNRGFKGAYRNIFTGVFMPTIAEEIRDITFNSNGTWEAFFSTGVFMSTYTKVGITFENLTVTESLGGTFNVLTWVYKLLNTTYSFPRLAVEYKYYYDITPSTYAYIVSQKLDAGQNIGVWRNIIINDTNNGIVYSVRGATSSAGLDTASWQNINNGDLIPLPTYYNWIQWRADFDSADQILYSVQINWLSDVSETSSDVSSVVFNDRYYLAYSTYSNTNTDVIVLDNNTRYTLFQDMPVNNFNKYNNQILFISGDKIYKLYDGINDYETSFEAKWVSKYLDFGIPDVDKTITKIGITAKGSGTLTVGYRSNYDITFSTFTITLNSTTDNYVVNLPIMSPAKYWQIYIRQKELNKRFEIQRINLYYTFEALKAR